MTVELNKDNPTFLIFGASSAIAQGVLRLLTHPAKDGEGTDSLNVNQVICISRTKGNIPLPNVTFIDVQDYSTSSVDQALESLQLSTLNIKGVYIFNGILHGTLPSSGQRFMPEKALSQFDEETFATVLAANTTTPIVIIQQVLAKINKKQQFKIAVLSARIGSIGDNGLGGWHSYRASKAALNMLMKNIAIECGRTYKGIKLISYHPGTTDSPLSKPFQANVPSDKLFGDEQSANYFLNVVRAQQFDHQLSYVDWQGQRIDW